MNVEELAVYNRTTHQLVGLVKFVDGGSYIVKRADIDSSDDVSVSA